MPETKYGHEYEYRCDSCGYQGDEYDRKPVEPEGRQAQCPTCHEPHLTRVLV